jgi:hypothetical protein
MTPLIILLVVFAGFGIYGAISDRADDRARRRKALRHTIEQWPADRRQPRTMPRAGERRTPP